VTKFLAWLECSTIAIALFGSALPAYAKDISCSFKTTSLGALRLSFGFLDPSNRAQFPLVRPVTTFTTNGNEVGDCNAGPGLNMVINVEGGTSRTLTNGAGGTIAYTLSGFPITLARPGNNKYTDFIAAGAPTGTIQWSAVADARAGGYSDSVTLSVTP
jgi:hypothetical protein